MALRFDEPQGRWVLLATVLGSSVALLDATVVNIALPTLGRDLDASFDALQWTVNAYTLTLASLILLGGSLGDRFGRRRVFVAGAAWFAVASLLCALVQTDSQLVGARALQGVGGALLTPGSLALIQSSFVPADRGRAVGAWSGLGGLATAVGPLVGGLLVAVSWRLVFLINLPICAAVILIALRHVPESRDEEADGGVDLTGALLGVLALGGVTYALVHGRADAATAVSGAVGLLAGAAFVVVERRVRHPMLPLSVFSSRAFAAINAVTLVVYAALTGVFFLLVVTLQGVAGWSPLGAGCASLPVTACLLLLSSRTGAASARTGPRRWLVGGPLVCAAGVLLLLRIDRDTSYATVVLPAVLLFGLGLGATVAPLTSSVLASAAPRHAGLASGVNNAVARTAGLLAVATLPLLGGLSGGDYRDPVALRHGFRVAMLACAALLVLGALLSAVVLRGAVEPEPEPA